MSARLIPYHRIERTSDYELLVVWSGSSGQYLNCTRDKRVPTPLVLVRNSRVSRVFPLFSREIRAIMVGSDKGLPALVAPTTESKSVSVAHDNASGNQPTTTSERDANPAGIV